jgi:dTDP-4-amino-4,6-dideoxygalactose transaminase
MTRRVPFLALRDGEDAALVRAAVERVLARGWFILGPELEAFEQEFASASQVRHVVGVGNGTDALALALRALGIGPGDEVITTPLSAAFTALSIVMAGARPVFADIDPVRLTIDPAAVEAAITPRTAAILPVHVYGQPADMTALIGIADRHGLTCLEDACQAHLASCAGRPVGTVGAAAAFSFYPTKNLGAIGDAGAVATNDAGLADRIRRLRNGGQRARYDHAEVGVNSRLDELQAAVLRERLGLLPQRTARRRALAARYRRALADTAVTLPPEIDPGHVYHLFPVLTSHRDAFQAHASERGIGTLVHYPIPLHRQGAFAETTTACPIAERVCEQICSLPLHPALDDEDIDAVADMVRAWALDPAAPPSR